MRKRRESVSAAKPLTRARHYLPNPARISIRIFPTEGANARPDGPDEPSPPRSLDDARDDALEVERFGDAEQDWMVAALRSPLDDLDASARVRGGLRDEF
jgi:hypothetical protein